MNRLAITLSAAILAAGCAGRPSLIPNSDPGLRRTSAEFAADAAKRHPFKGDLPSGGEALGRGSVDYTFKTVQVLNFSDEDWNDVELWINRKFVCWLPRLEKGKEHSKIMNFTMFYDDKGEYFETDNGKIRIEQFEMVRNGKIYSFKLGLAD